MPHHRLDFDADRALPYCNDLGGFKGIITSWVPMETFDALAERTLVIRVYRDPDGLKVSDVAITGARGEELGHVHKRYAADSECFKVLFATAHDAAKLMGAFHALPESPLKSSDEDKPLRKRPALIVTTLPPQEDPWRPMSPNEDPWGRKLEAPPQEELRRGFVGVGTTVRYGLTPKWAIGPHIVGGFVPTLRSHW